MRKFLDNLLGDSPVVSAVSSLDTATWVIKHTSLLGA